MAQLLILAEEFSCIFGKNGFGKLGCINVVRRALRIESLRIEYRLSFLRASSYDEP